MPESDIAALMPPAEVPAAQARWWRRWLPTLLGFFDGCIGGAMVAMLAGRMPETLSPGAVLALLAGLFVSAWPHVVLHEAGHAIARISRGTRAIAFGVGPLRMERRGDGHWHWRKGGGVRGIGGFATLVPQAAGARHAAARACSISTPADACGPRSCKASLTSHTSRCTLDVKLT